MSLREKLLAAVAKKKCAWDDDLANDNGFYASEDLTPLLIALIDCAVALEEQISDYDVSTVSAEKALAALERAVGE